MRKILSLLFMLSFSHTIFSMNKKLTDEQLWNLSVIQNRTQNEKLLALIEENKETLTSKKNMYEVYLNLRNKMAQKFVKEGITDPNHTESLLFGSDKMNDDERIDFICKTLLEQIFNS